jgi:hypothetical protein
MIPSTEAPIRHHVISWQLYIIHRLGLTHFEGWGDYTLTLKRIFLNETSIHQDNTLSFPSLCKIHGTMLNISSRRRTRFAIFREGFWTSMAALFLFSLYTIIEIAS